MTRSGMTLVLLSLFAAPLAAQATGTPSFHAPYRAFAQHEFGGTLSFPEGGGFALEGQYRFGYRQFDIGLRGGFFDSDAAGVDTQILLGTEARMRVITHTEDFPLDGSLNFGVGGILVEGASRLIIPGGLSLGRRLDVEGSQVSIIPFVQPTLWMAFGDNVGGVGDDFEVLFGFGLGADFRLSRAFDARVSVGLGDVEGVSISAVWVR